MVRISGPPADRYFSASPPLRVMKSSPAASAGWPEKKLTARSKVPHQALPATGVREGRAKVRQYQRRLRGRREVGRDLAGVVGRMLASWSSDAFHGTSCGVGLISTAPPSRLTAWSASRVTSATGRLGVSETRVAAVRVLHQPSWVRRSSAATIEPEPSGAGSAGVSHPRAVSRSAACCSCGRAGPAGPRAFRVPGCARGACHRSRSTSRSSALASQWTAQTLPPLFVRITPARLAGYRVTVPVKVSRPSPLSRHEYRFQGASTAESLKATAASHDLPIAAQFPARSGRSEADRQAATRGSGTALTISSSGGCTGASRNVPPPTKS